jgi:hypothetical protein
VVRAAFDAFPSPAFPQWKRRGDDDEDDARAAEAQRAAAGSRASTSVAAEKERAAGVAFVLDLSQTMTEGAKLHSAKQFMVRAATQPRRASPWQAAYAAC